MGERLAAPEKECDLVLKGGITSGVAYPPAIVELSDTYRFRNIGGTSAGAIAAAGAAAAEYSRQCGGLGATQGFPGLVKLQAELAAPGFLFSIFAPRDSAKPAWEAVAGLAARVLEDKPRPRWDQSKVRCAFWWFLRAGPFAWTTSRRGYWKGFAAAASLAAAVIAAPLFIVLSRSLAAHALLIPVLSGVFALGWVIALGLCGARVGGVGALFGVARGLSSAGFGLCPGSAGGTEAGALHLTDWLHLRLQTIAGKRIEDEPITISELASRGIIFRSVSSNLSLGQPYVLPLRRGAKSFLFHEDEMRCLFPKGVVDSMIAWSRRNPSSIFRMPSKWHRFPMGDEMPLVVATRLSLSFPLLVQAVRLYAVTEEAYAEFRQRKGENRELPELRIDQLEEHWFSDGGIASNFPIHIFDELVPQRPTFGITLVSLPLGQALSPESKECDVLLPLPRDFHYARPRHTQLSSTADFLRAIFETAQNFRDNAQSSLPGYRERIVQIGLRDGEGGLNLKMDAKTIEGIGKKGLLAAQLLVEHFHKGEKTSFDEHVWVRLYVFMAEMEREFAKIRGDSADWRDERRKQLGEVIRRQQESRETDQPWYRSMDAEKSVAAIQRIEDLLELAEKWSVSGAPNGPALFSRNPPAPEGQLRITPEI